MLRQFRQRLYFGTPILCCLLAILITDATARQSAAQVVVCRTEVFEIQDSYEKVLGKLDGVEASRKMLASQHLDLISFVVRKNPEGAVTAKRGKVSAKIDIVGMSCKYGPMQYLMSVEADEQQATIEVALQNPVNVLRAQSYCFVVTPVGKSNTKIELQHTLDVVLMRRRLEMINRIIERVTYSKASEQLCTLTDNMLSCVQELASKIDHSKVSSDSSDADANEDAETDSGDSSDLSTEKTVNQASKEQAANTQPNQGESPAVAVEENSKPSVEQPIEATENSPSDLQKQNNRPVASEDSTKPTCDSKAIETIEHQSDIKAIPVPEASRQPSTNDESTRQKASDNVKGLRLRIEGVSRGSGTMRIAIFKSEEQHLAFDARSEESKQGEAFRKESLPVRKSGKFEYEFSDVPYGKYVIAAFHDLDDNKKLNSSLIGMPSEPYGFSRNARGTFGAPSFSEAVITFDKDHAEFSFRIK